MIQPKISIIVPVYNAEAYLEDCIQSLIEQTMRECEFIFINDGSSDSSQEILESYQNRDSRIILLNQQNQGISMARNAGIEISKGTYIGFMDNDDVVKKDMFENLYRFAQESNLDIAVSRTILGRDKKYVVKESVFPTGIVYGKTFIQDNIIPNLLRVEDLFAVWNKIYKRELVFTHAVRFPAGRVMEEDNMFNLQAFNVAQRVSFTDYSGYFYKEVMSSESRQTIANDYFDKALQKFHFDYKKEYNLTISYAEMEKLKGVRFVHKICFYTYKCAIDKMPFKKKYPYVKNMVFHPEVLKVCEKYSKEIGEGKGLFEAAMLKIIKTKSTTGLYILFKLLQNFYHPSISELFRLINNPKINKPKIIKNNA